MGEAAARGKRHREIFAQQPNCIYCGGGTLATTVDHIPATSFFTLNQRPKGLEFPSCTACNHGARDADLVVAIVGRSWPDAVSPAEAAHFKALLTRANRRLPGMVEEMRPPRAAERRTVRELGLPEDGGLIRLDGPLVSSHMEAFGARLGMALHYDLTSAILPRDGGVAVRVYSNVDAIRGNIPDLEFLDPPKTLSQGRMASQGEFLYSIKATPGGRRSILYATFRQSFGVVAITSSDAGYFDDKTEGPATIYRPGLLGADIPATYRAAIRVTG